MITIRNWLQTLGLDRYAGSFEENDITIDLAQDLTNSDLKELGMASMGHRKLFFRGLAGLASASNIEAQRAISPKEPHQQPSSSSVTQNHNREASLPSVQTQPSPAVSRPTPPRAAPTSEAERRQLTVMFCDLVGSTELSTKHDPEELREMMGAYQTAAGAVIESYDGHVAQYLGDGLMVYFGWPYAHEDDAVRAVQAGLEVIDAVKSLDVAVSLSVRVGIATGPVVVGETGGGDPTVPKTAVGETPNLAARVQGMAEPDTVAIGGITRGLIGGVFELDELGSHSLKGIARPVELYRVLGDKGAESRFEATYADQLTPVIGRDSEIALQLDRWQRAKDGEGQVILLSGEPGIGKSRLIHLLREKLAEETYTPIRYQCSTHHSNSAFYPVIDQLERAAGFTRGDDSDVKLDKLEEVLSQATGDIARLFATLLTLPVDRYPAMNATSQEIKEQTLTALNDQLLSLASKNPVMFLIEDVQWCDPTTLELIGDMITRIIDARVLLVITYRPEFEPTWTGHAHVSIQTLNRLSRREGAEVVEKVTGGKSLPKEVLDLIVAKTDGIPLYVEELTKNVLEAGFLKDAGDHYELDGPLPALAIPTTLQESLIARLDRLNTVKQVAQIGACIGREFTHELVATVSPLSESELQASYQQLIEAQIILPQGGGSHGSYIFKHALLQDAAYDSLLRGPKRQFHDGIAEGLKAKFPEVVTTTPEVLASHLAKAERFSEAIDHWKDAGIQAKNASSNQEAASHFELALEHLKKEDPSPERDKRELELQTPLAVSMTALYGNASPKTGATFERALQLSEGMDRPPEKFQVLYGLSQNRWMGSRFEEGLQLSKELYTYADMAGDKSAQSMAHRSYGGAIIWEPNFKSARDHFEKAIEVYDEKNPHAYIDKYGSDPKAVSLVMLGFAKAYEGFPDQAVTLTDEAVSYAEQLGFPFVIAWIHWMAAWTYRDLGEVKRAEKHAQAQLEIAEEKNFSPMKQCGSILLGWAQYRQNVPNSVEKIELGFKQLLGLGPNFVFWELKHIIDHIDVYQREGKIGQAKEKIGRAMELIDGDGTKWNHPEVLKRKALICMAETQSNSTEVESIFVESLELARLQKSKLSELSTATSLARFWGEGQERQKAYDLLLPVYDWYTEGFETAHLKEAKELLSELQ